MVYPVSHGVPRAPWYSGTSQESHPTFRLRGCHPLWRSVPGPSARMVVCNSPDLPQ